MFRESINPMRLKLWLVLLLFCVLCIWPTSRTVAQNRDFQITISVADEQGPVKDAVINISRTNDKVTLVGDGNGNYTKTEVTLNTQRDYIYTVEAPGHQLEKGMISHDQLQSASQDGEPITLPQLTLKRTSGAGNDVRQATTKDGTATTTVGSSNNGQSNSDRQTTTSTPGPFSTLIATILFFADQWLATLLVVSLIAAGLVWKAGYLPLPRRRANGATVNPAGEAIVDSLNRIVQSIEVIKEQHKQLSAKQEELLRLVGQISQQLPKPGQPPAQDNTRPREQGRKEQPKETSSPAAKSALVEAPLEAQAVVGDEPLRTSMKMVGSIPEEVRISYTKLAQGEMVTPDPIYLNAEAKTSMVEVYEDSNVYLREVNSTQGAFVLFKGFNEQSWVFPNPHMPYREKALKPVFPGLSEAEFNSSKLTIIPQRVSPLEGGRWKVGANQ